MSVLSALQQIGLYLFQINGVPLTISYDTLVKDDFSKVFEGAVCLRFINRGQFAVMLNDTEILKPGEIYTEGDVNGPGIYHKYKIQFLEALPKAEAAPDAGSVDIPYVFPGNRLDVRVYKRSY